jgi:trk system potassium uptake protein TrkH
MRSQVVLRYVGFVLLFNAFFLLISAGISIASADNALYPLIFSTIVCLLFGIFPFIFVPSTFDITNKEGLSIVIVGWLLSCLIGAIPYILWGGVFSFTNAWFESVSGFTTTGSSILSNVEALPPGLLFWRATTHWIGGIGIIVFVLAMMPSKGLASMILYRSEVSSLAQDNFHSRTRKTFKILLSVYLGLTVLETLALVIQGMSLFDAVAHSFATVATGGFSTKNLSVGHFSSLGIEITIIIFMVLPGIHFGLLYLFITGNPRNLYQSTIVRYYLVAMLAGVLLVTISVHGSHYSLWSDALRYSAFQVISIGTSTGFANTDSTVWPPFAQLIILFFTLQCACAGSTSGGIKADRIVLLWKSFLRRIMKLRHPRAIVAVKVNGMAVDDEIVETVLVYILIYLTILLISSLLITSFGIDIMTAFSGVAAAMGNVGPGFGSVGSLNNYGHLPDFVKWVLTIDMLVGRLEIYGLILFASIRWWK